MTVDRVIKVALENNPNIDVELLRSAYEFADMAHYGQKRKSGESYIQHCLHTAFELAQIKADQDTIVAGILHDVPEDTNYSLDDIEDHFGPEVAKLVGGITKLGKIKYRGIERYKENLKRMFIAMAEDIRVIFIKFSDRLHNLRTLDSLPPDKQIRIAKETLEIYAPIAGLLGIWRMKWQMEDICFKYLQPEEYKRYEYKYEIDKRAERNQLIQKIKQKLSKELRENGLTEFNIEGRFKHLYSIYQKMQNKNRKFDEIYDVFALRIIVPTVHDCYKVLGIIHNTWKPKAKRFKDYISVPKPNGYQSLHTTIFGPEGKAIEFQIRTQEMHDQAVYGIAAHWHYKNKNLDKTDKTQPKWIQEVLNIQRDTKDIDDFVSKIKFDIFQDRIFVFSPKGDVFELPEDSTPIDFAYAVHTDIGNKATGVLINDKISTLDASLRNGDLVEILIEKNRKNPNPDWIKFVKTKHAKDRIRQFSKKSKLPTLKRIIGM